MGLFGRGKEQSPSAEEESMVRITQAEYDFFKQLVAQHQAQQRLGDDVRNTLVSHLEEMGVSQDVANAMRETRRAGYAPVTAWPLIAEGNHILPVTSDGISTMSEPLLVARMLHMLEVQPTNNVLEIGAGSGYNAALLARIAHQGHVTTVDVDKDIVDFAERNLESDGIENVTVVHGDGREGYPDNALYDRVIVTAALPEIPHALVQQMQDNALFVAPYGYGTSPVQMLVRGEMRGCRLHISPDDINEERDGVQFVPMRPME